MQDFVKVVMNDFTKIDNAPFLDLDLILSVKLESCCVNEAHISDVVLAIDRANHKLCFPEFLIIWNFEMTGFTFTDFEDADVSINDNLEIFELLCVNLFKLELKFVFWNLRSLNWKLFPLKVAMLKLTNFHNCHFS